MTWNERRDWETAEVERWLVCTCRMNEESRIRIMDWSSNDRYLLPTHHNAITLFHFTQESLFAVAPPSRYLLDQDDPHCILFLMTTTDDATIVACARSTSALVSFRKSSCAHCTYRRRRGEEEPIESTQQPNRVWYVRSSRDLQFIYILLFEFHPFASLVFM